MSNTFVKDQVVWAKISGYPWWPGYVKSLMKNNLYEVAFFTDFSRAHLCDVKIKPFNDYRDKADKKNKRLQNALKMAERIIKGESTILDEQSHIDLKLAKQNISTPEIINKSNRNRSLSIEALNDCSVFANELNIKAEQAQLHRRYSELPKGNAAHSEIELNKLGEQNFKEDRAFLKTKEQPKGTSLDCPQMIIEAQGVDGTQEADDGAKNSKKVKTKKENPPPKFIKNQQKECVCDPPTFLNQNEVSNRSRRNERRNSKTSSTNNIRSSCAESTKVLDKLESDMENIWLSLRQTRIDTNGLIKQIKEWFKAFQMLTPSDLEGLFCRNIGSYLHLIRYICCEKIKESPRFQGILDEIVKIIESIKDLLVDQFFKLKQEHRDTLLQKAGISTYPTDKQIADLLKSLESNGCDTPPHQTDIKIQSEDFRCLIEETQSSNNKIDEEIKTPCRHNDQLLIDAKTTFRVCKKIAKILYTKRKGFLINKKICEFFSNKIDDLIRKMSKTEIDYKRNVCKFITKLDSRCELFLALSFQYFKEGDFDGLFDNLQEFITQEPTNSF